MNSETPRILAVISAVVLIAVVVDGRPDDRPRYIDCADSVECGLGYCCVVGKGRYSLPSCMAMGEIESPCMPKAPPIPPNMTLSYPDGQTVFFTNVYTLMCPCVAGLTCSEEKMTCQDPNETFMNNQIDDY